MSADTKEDVVRLLKTELPRLKSRYGVKRIALFGSFVSGAPSVESDVDLVVELGRPLGFEFVSMVNELELRLGRKVDVTTSETLEVIRSHPRYQRVADNILAHLSYVDA